tara:strand:+ start:177 stop:1688 length:1512 start_codon:yes stop_codon:yes gene_type:complete
MSKFYLTTPLYYVNDKPHLGTAYTTILADVISRYYKTMNEDVFFLTGTDEHGQKVQEAAAKRQIEPKVHVDEYVIEFKKLWEKLHIDYDDFIRTTEKRHSDKVKKILQQLFDDGEIYKDKYEGMYSVSEERFITQKEAEEGEFRQVKKLVEENYFFKMSKYQSKLIKYIKNNPEFIQPEGRKNEVLGFLNKPLNDLCISRPKSRLKWGIELPFDNNYVTYVWFDALLNYITAIGWDHNEESFRETWPANYHLIGKDILTTHAVYWPTMLLAIGLPLPKTIFAHGWWLSGESKMSKSLGNIINPLNLIDKYGVDSLRYFLMKEMVLGKDSTFTIDLFIERYNSDLANDFGNLVNRVTIMIHKHFNSRIPEPGNYNEIDLELIGFAKTTPQLVIKDIENLKIPDGIEKILILMRKINKYLEVKSPWKSIKSDSSQRSEAATTMYISADLLRICTQLLNPVMPNKTTVILKMLGSTSIQINNYSTNLVKVGQKLGNGKSPFPRILI